MSLETNPPGEAGELGQEEDASTAPPTPPDWTDDLTKDDKLLCEELFGTSEPQKRRIDDPNSAIASREEERQAAAHTKTRQDKRDARRNRREVEGTKESKDEKPQAEEREWHGRGWSSRRWRVLSKAAEPTKKEMADDLTKDDDCDELFGTSEPKKRRIDDLNSAIASRQDKRDARRHCREVEGTKEDASKSKDEKPQAEEREWHGRGWSSRRWSTWSSWQSHDEKRREDDKRRADEREWQERKDEKRRADEREWQERKDEMRRAEERELAGREALLKDVAASAAAAALAAAAAEGDKHERLGAPKEHSLVPLIHGQPRDRGRVPVLKGLVARAAAAAATAATNTKLWVRNVGTPEAPKLRQFAHGSFVFSETRGGWIPLDCDDGQFP